MTGCSQPQVTLFLLGTSKLSVSCCISYIVFIFYLFVCLFLVFLYESHVIFQVRCFAGGESEGTQVSWPLSFDLILQLCKLI